MSQLEDVVSSIKPLEVQGLFPQKQRGEGVGTERPRVPAAPQQQRFSRSVFRLTFRSLSVTVSPPRGRPAPAPSPGAAPGAFPIRAPPPVSSAAGPEPPVPGAFVWPGQNGESAVPPARAEWPPLEQLYREGPLLGSVYSRTRLADRVPHKGALVPLELALLWMVSWPGFRGVVRLLDWFECPEGFALVMERPERCQELWYFLHERGFLTEPVARGLFGQVLEAGRHHCSSRRVLHRHIKAENVLVDLATGEAKLIDFGCGTILQDTFYTRMPGEHRARAEPGTGGSPLCWQRRKREGKTGNRPSAVCSQVAFRRGRVWLLWNGSWQGGSSMGLMSCTRVP
ncbi:LOW QUALITY PROTEIN: serine/threonine-protein kinase pim-2-like [Melospiza georgiana]|uniref:LOW QUALITY PROTEIN: serine/threonine-protein kinase pim-2-like n=1 Tax=Melospiza georgiana TaxID=44398 RepID=UPI0025AC2763|nr:LOW QUALITY PROTEIN: serine/threonine-protein kinase pim-2-like [Melospiza georgiana]